MATDHAGFERLYRSVHADLHEYVVRRFGLEGAEDVVAEALATVYARWADAPASLDEQRAWTFGVMRRKLLEGHRRRSRALRLVPSRPDIVPAVDDGVAAVDRARRLLERLPEHERDALYLTVIAGFSSAQAAQILECSVTAITSRTSRARRRLHELLEDERWEEVDVHAHR